MRGGDAKQIHQGSSKSWKPRSCDIGSPWRVRGASVARPSVRPWRAIDGTARGVRSMAPCVARSMAPWTPHKNNNRTTRAIELRGDAIDGTVRGAIDGTVRGAIDGTVRGVRESPGSLPGVSRRLSRESPGSLPGVTRRLSWRDSRRLSGDFPGDSPGDYDYDYDYDNNYYY